ncbi:hypothetical protein [Streptodolium elevatio]
MLLRIVLDVLTLVLFGVGLVTMPFTPAPTTGTHARHARARSPTGTTATTPATSASQPTAGRTAPGTV